MKKNSLDTSNELILQPSAHGIKLINPNSISDHHNTLPASLNTISQVLKLPCNVYFLSKNSIIRNINEQTIITCGYSSVKDAIGNNCTIAAKKEVAQSIIENDAQVIKSARMNIFEEHFIRHDELCLSAISLKFPWYDSENKIVGIFGCSIIIKEHHLNHLIESINSIAKLGLPLSPNSIVNTTSILPVLPGKKIHDVYLSNRESQCLYLVIKGNTIKMIAKKLLLSPRTIEHYIDNIKAKVKVSSKAELIDKAIPYFFP